MNTKPYEGFQLGKAWLHHVMLCQHKTPRTKVSRDGSARTWDAQTLPHAATAVAAAYREHADHRTLTAYLGRDMLGWYTGLADRHAREYRDALADAGWLVDTGRREGAGRRWSTVYRLEIPRCQCGAHDAWVMAAEDASERLQRAVAVVQGHVPGSGQRPGADLDATASVHGFRATSPDSVHPSACTDSVQACTDFAVACTESVPQTAESTAEATTEAVDVVTDVDRRARERDASGPLGAAYGDAPLEPRTGDEDGDPIGAAVIGYGAADVHPQAPTTTAPGGADEEIDDVIDFACETHGVELPCRDCDDLDTQADLAAGRPSPAEHDASHAAGGHDTGSPRAEDLILAAARKAAPGAITDSEAGRAMRDSGDPRGYLGVLGALVLAGQLHRRVSYPHDGGSLLEYWVPGGEEPPLRPMHHSARPRRPEADETDTAGVGGRGRGYAPSPAVSDTAMDFLGSFGRDTGPADDDLDDDCDDLDDDPWSSF